MLLLHVEVPITNSLFWLVLLQEVPLNKQIMVKQWFLMIDSTNECSSISVVSGSTIHHIEDIVHQFFTWFYANGVILLNIIWTIKFFITSLGETAWYFASMISEQVSHNDHNDLLPPLLKEVMVSQMHLVLWFVGYKILNKLWEFNTELLKTHHLAFFLGLHHAVNYSVLSWSGSYHSVWLLLVVNIEFCLLQHRHWNIGPAMVSWSALKMFVNSWIVCFVL